jgi:hypothetical protein
MGCPRPVLSGFRVSLRSAGMTKGGGQLPSDASRLALLAPQHEGMGGVDDEALNRMPPAADVTHPPHPEVPGSLPGLEGSEEDDGRWRPVLPGS